MREIKMRMREIPRDKILTVLNERVITFEVFAEHIEVAKTTVYSRVASGNINPKGLVYVYFTNAKGEKKKKSYIRLSYLDEYLNDKPTKEESDNLLALYFEVQEIISILLSKKEGLSYDEIEEKRENLKDTFSTVDIIDILIISFLNIDTLKRYGLDKGLSKSRERSIRKNIKNSIINGKYQNRKLNEIIKTFYLDLIENGNNDLLSVSPLRILKAKK